MQNYIFSLQLDTKNNEITVPGIKLEMFPKEAFTAGKRIISIFDMNIITY